jgi:hypothetical protein
MRRLLLPGISTLAIFAGGCDMFGPEDPGVSFVMDATLYAPGDSVTAELRNDGRERALYNFCFTALDRLDGSSWDMVVGSLFAPPGGACLTIAFSLEPGRSATMRARLPHDLGGGTYRLRTNISGDGTGTRELPTEGFSVEP